MISDIGKRILDIGKSHEKFIVEIRRLLHMHPEMAHREFETHKILMENLEKLDINLRTVAGTGIEAIMNGKEKGKTVAIRADMDALPINEENDVEYRSLHPGYMHACGHDAHMSMVFGSALILNEIKGKIKGTIKLIFQPAEEEVTLGGQSQ